MIRYEPNKLIKQIAPERKIKKLLKANLSIKKAALSFVDDLEIISKKSVLTVALKVVAAYKERIRKDPEARQDIFEDPRQLIQRVQNQVVNQISQDIKNTYSGESYVWLPSDADEPDPEHQLNYGKTFQIGDGEMPGDRYGCRCGMEILVKDSRLDL